MSGYFTGSWAFFFSSSFVSLNLTALLGQGTMMFKPGIIRLKDSRPVLRSLKVREISSLSITTLASERYLREIPPLPFWMILGFNEWILSYVFPFFTVFSRKFPYETKIRVFEGILYFL